MLLRYIVVLTMTVLDLFILSQLERGLETPYDLLHRAGLSLGSSVPALRRLIDTGLIKREKEAPDSKRPRHVYKLTTVGRKQARNGWQQYLNGQSVPADLDEILRVCDLANHNAHDGTNISAFLDRAARDRSALARQAQLVFNRQSGLPLDYISTRAKCDAGRFESEEAVLSQLAVAVRKSSVTRRRAPGTKLKPDR
jgi:DNA-binding PadR family transcriptional regulator